MGIVIYNGVSSKDYHIEVEHPPGYGIPERDYESVHVPGRNGDVIMYNGAYQNVKREYEISVGSLEKYMPELAVGISEWLFSSDSYAKLEDSYEPEHYRMAICLESTDIENILFHGGRGTVIFNCKPQRFLKVGDKSVRFTASGHLKNPTGFNALPIVTINGSGEGLVNIGGYVIGITDIGGSITINSEIQDAYSGTLNKNNVVSLGNGFPKLSRGVNNISFSGGVTSLEVIPKWWTL